MFKHKPTVVVLDLENISLKTVLRIKLANIKMVYAVTKHRLNVKSIGLLSKYPYKFINDPHQDSDEEIKQILKDVDYDDNNIMLVTCDDDFEEEVYGLDNQVYWVTTVANSRAVVRATSTMSNVTHVYLPETKEVSV